MELKAMLLVVVIGFFADMMIGDPYGLPHPIRLFGRLISFCERRYNKGNNRVAKGGVVWLLLTASVLCSLFLMNILIGANLMLFILVNATLFFYALSNRTLIVEGMKVENHLVDEDIDEARRALSMIVGRDTDKMSESEIRRAVIETLSENLNDGVVAPLFFFAIGGVPLMMWYKMVNTLDSMVGYKNEKYRDFGCISAKMDDVASYIPARITALLIALVSFSWRAIRFVKRYGRAHSSPNSGYSEAAIAGVLDCKLGGGSYYFGECVEKPYIGENEREITHKDVIKCCFVNIKVSLVVFFILIVVVNCL